MASRGSVGWWWRMVKLIMVSLGLFIVLKVLLGSPPESCLEVARSPPGEGSPPPPPPPPPHVLDPLYPAIPYSADDHIYYSAWDGQKAYENQGSTVGTTNRKPGALLSDMIYKAQTTALQYLSERGPHPYKVDHCSDVRYRTIPTEGVEVDVLCRKSWSQVDRVTIMLPLAAPKIVFHTQPTVSTSTPAINIVVPLVGRSDAFHKFLDNLREILSAGDLHLGLTVVYFEDGKSEAARATLDAANTTIPLLTTHFHLLPHQKFSRSKGLKVGVEESSIKAPIVFLCDLDVAFTRSFLERCLATPVPGSQVFFPVPFSQYNPGLMNPLGGALVDKSARDPFKDLLMVDDNTGFWRLWGHGMVCAYQTDFLHINGFNPNRSAWGGEDLDFLKETQKLGYKVVRSLDYGLFHRYHTKDCSVVGNKQTKACILVKAMHEASSLIFGLWHIRDQVNTTALCTIIKEMQAKRRKGAGRGKGKTRAERREERKRRRNRVKRSIGESMGGSIGRSVDGASGESKGGSTDGFWRNPFYLQTALVSMVYLYGMLLIFFCQGRLRKNC